MQIIPIYDAAANADASFRQDIQAAIDIWDVTFTANITVRIDIEKGEYDGHDMSFYGYDQNTSLGYPSGLTPISYPTLRNDLISAVPGFFNNSNLPNATSVNGHSSFNISSAQERIFGILPAINNTSFIDGHVGIGTGFSAGAVRISAALHEIGHALGRVPGSELDLFRFTSVGNRLFDHGDPKHDGPEPAATFSIDGGVTTIADWGQTSDPSDFLNNFRTGNDPFNENVGNLGSLTNADKLVTEALGFRISTDTTSPSLIHEGSITLAIGATATIPSSQLQFDDNVSTHAQETYSVVTAPAHGTLLKSGSAISSFTQADIDNGLISYRQDGSTVSSDSFTFRVTDAAGNQTTAQQFQFQISPPPDRTAPSLIHEGSITVAIGATATIPSSQLQFDDNVSTHAQETYSIVTAPAHGTLLRNGSATSSFTQADIDSGLIAYREDGSVASSDSFIFRVTDAAGNQTTAQQFQFQISAPPDTTPPSLVHDGSISLAIGATATIPSSQLQFDDNVSTHGQETYSIVTAPGHGTLLRNGAPASSFTQADIDSGLIAYRGDGTSASSDSFIFKVTDAAGNQTIPLQFQLHIFDQTPPTLVHDGSITVGIGGTANIPSSQLQFDDNVSTHAQETYSVTSAPIHGTLLRNGSPTSSFTQADIDNGLISYREDGSPATSDAFSFRVADAAGNTFATSFQINIVPINHAPVANNDSYSTAFNTPLTVTAASGLLVNDTDQDGDSLFVSSFTLPSHGALTSFSGDGSFTYVPNFGYSGPDSFTYFAHDPFVNSSSPATVSISVAPVTQFAPLTPQIAAFTPDAGGWNSDNQFPRKLADVNGDGIADIVAFGIAGTYVSIGAGDGSFGSPSLRLSQFGTGAGGWSSDDRFPRELADVNGDHMADIVGFADGGVYVSLATGGGSFGPLLHIMDQFGATAGSWTSQDRFPRELADVNGDGMADIVGFGAAGVYVSLATGGGGFAPLTLGLNQFGVAAGGWSSQDRFPRELADVNGDHRADIVGFGANGVYVSLSNGNGTFAPLTQALQQFGVNAGGWISDNIFPRQVADINGDGKVDIVGFGAAGVYLALGNGNGTFRPLAADLQQFGTDAGGWSSQDRFPRELADVNHDGAADIVGFGGVRVYEALSHHFDLA